MFMKKKILITGSSMTIGGVQKALLSLLNTIDLKKYEIDLLLIHPYGEYLNDIRKEINIIAAPKEFEWIMLPKGHIIRCLKKLFFKPLYLYIFLKNIIRGLLIKNMGIARQYMWNDCYNFLPKQPIKYDIALDFSGLLRCYIINNVTANKKYTWIHSDYRVYKLNKELDKQLLEKYDNIFCVSETCQKIFNTEFPQLTNKSKVLRNSIDLAHIIKKSKEKGFCDKFEGIRLLDITRIDPNKGLDLAVKVCKKLKDKNVKFRWYILGNDSLGYQKELQKIIKQNEVEDYFILLGFTNNPYPYMVEADIIVHFSRFEGRSVSIDEAMVLCKPILLTNYESAKDQITSGVNGIICDFDEELLTQSLLQLINEPQRRESLTNNLKLENKNVNVHPF